MRYLRFSVLFAPFIVLAMPLSAGAAADTVSSHMAALHWLTGTYRCTNYGVIGGKRQKTTTSTFDITRDGKWLDLSDPKDKSGMTRFTYNRYNGKYVYVSTNSDGSYEVGYFTVTPNALTVVFPSALSDAPDDMSPSMTVSRMPSGYTFVSTGTAASGRNKGKAYNYRSVCTK